MSKKSRTIKSYIRKMVYEGDGEVIKRIESHLCFKCGLVSKPDEIIKLAWLCDKCEKEVLSSVQTSPKKTHYTTKRGWFSPGSTIEKEKDTTIIDGNLFLDSQVVEDLC